jgi:glycerol-3-phosphate acyltransferase PlsY
MIFYIRTSGLLTLLLVAYSLWDHNVWLHEAWFILMALFLSALFSTFWKLRGGDPLRLGLGILSSLWGVIFILLTVFSKIL